MSVGHDPLGIGNPWSGRYLDAGLGQADLEGDLLAHEDVRVARFGEQRLEHVELVARERRPLATLLPAGSAVAVDVRRKQSGPVDGHRHAQSHLEPVPWFYRYRIRNQVQPQLFSLLWSSTNRVGVFNSSEVFKEKSLSRNMSFSISINQIFPSLDHHVLNFKKKKVPWNESVGMNELNQVSGRRKQSSTSLVHLSLTNERSGIQKTMMANDSIRAVRGIHSICIRSDHWATLDSHSFAHLRQNRTELAPKLYSFQRLAPQLNLMVE